MCKKEMENLKPDETQIEGQWLFDGKTIKADSACERIDWLIKNNLKAIKTDKSGWNALYQDQKDKRYWLHYYPKSEMHGGGPPALKAISNNEASQRFGE
tara:strand:- start:147 stop:443 length:297 start_codon:yes stop_codon:yes gene_type:complete